jgi:hypothetical protein
MRIENVLSAAVMKEIGRDAQQQAESKEPATFQRTSRIMNRILNEVADVDNLSVKFTNQGWTEALS